MVIQLGKMGVLLQQVGWWVVRRGVLVSEGDAVLRVGGTSRPIRGDTVETASTKAAEGEGQWSGRGDLV